MDFTTFTEKVTKGVQQFLGDQVDVSVRDIRKNNGIFLKGMTMFAKGSNMSPTIYLNDFFEEYNRGKALSSVVGDIVKIYDKTKVHGNMNMDFFLDYEKVRKQIYCRLINYEKNKDILEEIPHKKYLDMAVVCYFGYTNEIIGNGTIMIHESHLESWNIKKEELIEWALENTEKTLGFQCLNMMDIMRGMLLEGLCAENGETDDFKDEESEEMTMECAEKIVDNMLEEKGKGPMYVVTNRHKCLGAICMIFDSVLSKMAEKMGEGFVILPSSVHEVILVSGKEAASAEHLKEMVTEINTTQVEPQEVLSNNVYYYDNIRHKVIML